MNKRLEQFLAAENINQSQLADLLNVARASISHILAGRNKPGYDFILTMMKKFPKLNIEWLLDGKGKMYKDITNEGANNIKDDNLFTIPLSELPNNNEFATNYTSEEQIVQPNKVKTAQNEAQIVDNEVVITKIVVFYSNNTFTEFKPK